MKCYRILSATGQDRPGIVFDVSQFLLDHSCNMADSRMAVLGGQFSLMLLFSGLTEEVDSLAADLEAFEAKCGLRALLLEASDPKEAKQVPSLPVRLEVVAMDEPGIMFQIAKVLERFQVNVEILDAHLSPAPTSGTTVSSVKMKLAVPQSVSLPAVKEALMELAGKINLDILFQPVHE